MNYPQHRPIAPFVEIVRQSESIGYFSPSPGTENLMRSLISNSLHPRLTQSAIWLSNVTDQHAPKILYHWVKSIETDRIEKSILVLEARCCKTAYVFVFDTQYVESIWSTEVFQNQQHAVLNLLARDFDKNHATCLGNTSTDLSGYRIEVFDMTGPNVLSIPS